MMKKVLFLIIAFFFFIINGQALKLPDSVDITAEAMILTNLDTGDVLYTKNENETLSMASLTKIMTAYTVLDKIDNLDRKVTIKLEDLETLWVYTLAGLKVDDEVTIRDLLYGLLLVSGADCAWTLARVVGGDVPSFVDMMNKEAQRLGLRRTHFVDPAGGEDDDISTAREMSLLLKEALKNSTFKRIFETNHYIMSNGLEVTNYTQAYAVFHGLDPALLKGNKSGYTDAAGLLLASTAVINETNYMLVVCKSEINQYYSSHVLDSYKIYDYIEGITFDTYNVFKKDTLLRKIPVVGGTTSLYYVLADRDLDVMIPVSLKDEIRLDFNLVDSITPFNRRGDNLGFIDIYVGEDLVDTYHVYLYDDIFTEQETNQIIIIIIILLIFLCIVLLCINIYMSPKKSKVRKYGK